MSSSEPVEISIRNYSLEPISDIPVELIVDGDVIISEIYTGTVNPNQANTYQFTETVNMSTVGQTYTIEAKTNLDNDGYIPNDGYVKEITHLFNKDVGVFEVSSPNGATENLEDETIIIKVKNFGNYTASGFDIEYVLDGGAPVVQTFTGYIGSGDCLLYTSPSPRD